MPGGVAWKINQAETNIAELFCWLVLLGELLTKSGQGALVNELLDVHPNTAKGSGRQL